MMEEGALAFCFGPGSRMDTSTAAWRRQVEVGATVVAALRAQRFDVEWGGSPADGSPDAHRLLAAIAGRRAGSMSGSAEAIDSAAAVAVTDDLLRLLAAAPAPE
jgi:hypothetical protein